MDLGYSQVARQQSAWRRPPASPEFDPLKGLTSSPLPPDSDPKKPLYKAPVYTSLGADDIIPLGLSELNVSPQPTATSPSFRSASISENSYTSPFQFQGSNLQADGPTTSTYTPFIFSSPPTHGPTDLLGKPPHSNSFGDNIGQHSIFSPTTSQSLPSEPSFSSLPSTFTFSFSSPPSALSTSGPKSTTAVRGSMAKEREAPKAPLSPPKLNQFQVNPLSQPEFGKPTSIQAPKQSNVFNIPKSNRPRPEHHRPASILPQQVKTVDSRSGEPVRNVHSEARGDPDLLVINRPSNFPPATTRPHPAAVFSSQPSVSARNPDVVEITRPFNFTAPVRPAAPTVFSQAEPYDYKSFNFSGPGNWANQAVSTARVFEEDYGSFDPGTYIDSAKANENIKALLEGAFEDDDDRPKTRLRKKKIEAGLDALSNKSKGLDVSGSGDAEEEEEEDDGTIEGLGVKLLPHQIEGVVWMRDKEFGTKKIKGILPKGGILADDMGLGKTIQSIALILTNTKPPQSELKDNDKRKLHPDTHHATLVVAPLALIKQWEAEIKEKVTNSHKLKVYVHHGPQRYQRASDLKKYDVVITTYQTLSSEHGQSGNGLHVGCFGVHWYRVILDEAHSIKNRNAKATKACCALKSEYRWCLTGTPMQNNLDELQSLIHFLQIKPYNELPVWRDQITKPMSSGRGGIAIRRLQVYLKAFMKRRTKDVLKKDGALTTGMGLSNKDPSNTFQITKREIEKIEAEFSPTEREYYDRLEQRAGKSLEKMMSGDALNYASALVLLLRLRQACNSPTLVARSLNKDKDALATGQTSGTQSPRKMRNSDDDLDSVADMLGCLSVANKKCDVCQIDLNKEERSSGAIRCTECEDDLKAQMSKSKRDKKAKKTKSKHSHPSKLEKPVLRKQNRRRVILDSDDEEGEGEWIVPKDKQKGSDLGKAGGTDDEDAEGGGEWLNSDDSDSENEIKSKLKAHKKKIISLDSSDEDDDEDLEEEDEDEDTSEDESNDMGMKDIVLSTKIRNLLQVLRRESGEHKFIVFSQFTTMLDLIEPFLRRDGLIFTRYDGSMRNDQREASLERLRNSPKTRILLCSLRCGSLGLNLTAASRVVIMEPFWNPFVEEQAIDRVHRLNQTLDVIVYKMTIKDTVEARILELQEKKRELANATIEGKAGVGKLSLKDLLALFHHDAEHALGTRGLKQDYGTRTRILGTTPSQSLRSISQSQSGIGTDSARTKGLGADKARVPSWKEDSVYGRRW